MRAGLNGAGFYSFLVETAGYVSFMPAKSRYSVSDLVGIACRAFAVELEMKSSVQDWQILRVFIKDLVVDRHRAADCALATFLSGAQTDEADDIGDVAMWPQLGGTHAAPVLTFRVVETVVPDFLD